MLETEAEFSIATSLKLAFCLLRLISQAGGSFRLSRSPRAPEQSAASGGAWGGGCLDSASVCWPRTEGGLCSLEDGSKRTFETGKPWSPRPAEQGADFWRWSCRKKLLCPKWPPLSKKVPYLEEGEAFPQDRCSLKSVLEVSRLWANTAQHSAWPTAIIQLVEWKKDNPTRGSTE